MPQPSPEMHDAQYLKSLTAAIGGLVTVILAMVAFITNGFKKTQEGQQDQLDEGTAEFTNLKLRVQHLEDDNKAIRNWNIMIEKDLDLALDELRRIHDFQTKVCLLHEKQHGEKIL